MCWIPTRKKKMESRAFCHDMVRREPYGAEEVTCSFCSHARFQPCLTNIHWVSSTTGGTERCGERQRRSRTTDVRTRTRRIGFELCRGGELSAKYFFLYKMDPFHAEVRLSFNLIFACTSIK